MPGGCQLSMHGWGCAFLFFSEAVWCRLRAGTETGTTTLVWEIREQVSILAG